MDHKALIDLYTDGSCLGNPGAGGWAVVLRYEHTSMEISGGESRTTNNRMELMAAVQGLESLNTPSYVRLHTDSRYLYLGITRWLESWLANHWRTASGKPVKNSQLWQRLVAAAVPHQIEWIWVRGHSGHQGNQQADRLAHLAARKVGQKIS